MNPSQIRAALEEARVRPVKTLGQNFLHDRNLSRWIVTQAEIKPDDFFGMSQGDAARKYLEMVGHAVELEKLVEVLKKGGCKVGGADPKRTLYISLVRDTRNFVPPQTGYIGLRKFYPHLKPAGTKLTVVGKRAKAKSRQVRRVKLLTHSKTGEEKSEEK